MLAVEPSLGDVQPPDLLKSVDQTQGEEWNIDIEHNMITAEVWGKALP